MNFTSEALSLSFSETNGRLLELRFVGGENLLGHGAAGPVLDLTLGEGGWLSSVEAARLAKHSSTEDSLILEVELGPLTLYDTYRIEGSLIERKVRVENRGGQEIQLRGLRMMLVGALLGEIRECRFEAPATILRPRIPLEKAIHLRDGLSSDPFLTPGAQGWLNFLGNAPDMTPGLLALHNPVRQESLMVWYYSEVESATPRVVGDDQALNLGHDLDLAGWLAPGASLSGGPQYIQLVRGSWAEALEVYRQTYARVELEPPMYETVPDWVSAASIYEVHPGQFGGFRGLTEQLPRIHSMGFDVLYLMPVMAFDNRNDAVWDENWAGSGSPYAIKDFEAFEPTLGTEADFIELVTQAHRNGMKVLMDFVAQGSAIDARYVEEHPDWYCRDEKGNLVSSHGWNDTYSLDWANPEYQAYMLDWAGRFVREYGIDGYRVDAPFGKEPNWDRRVPYHASTTSLGSLRMLEQLQRTVKQLNPETALLCEAFGPVFVKSHDFQYDYHPHGMLYSLLQDKLSVEEIGEYLQDYWRVMPPSAKRVLFTETHDTRVGFPSYGLRGSAAERAMFAILVLAGFIPMLWAGQEIGTEQVYRRILAARNVSAALLQGVRQFNTIGCNNEHVLSIVCLHQDELLWGVVSLYPERTPLNFDLSKAGITGTAFTLHDLLAGNDWDEYGQDQWSGDEAQKITLSLIPFVPYYFQIIQT